jgi:hypothetical protein
METHEPRLDESRGGVINAEEVRRVLERASRDAGFAARLLEQDSNVFEDYEVPSEARAALLSGDIRWIEEHVGKLTESQKAWLKRRLEQESW